MGLSATRRRGGNSCSHGFPRRNPRRHSFSAKLRFETLEERRLLSVDAPPMELLQVSPALFVENQGQWADPAVRFVHQGNGANVVMTDAGPAFQVFKRDDMGQVGKLSYVGQVGNLPHVAQFSARFVGANPTLPVGLDCAETLFNYYLGDPATWRTGVTSYQTVAYPNLYPGIDLLTWGQRDSLKYEFHVAPGADPGQIQVRYEGVAGLALDEDGSLRVDLGPEWGELTDEAPYIYQVIDGRQVPVAGRFAPIDSQTYAFDITGRYDAARELVIDPDLAWTTYLGGSNEDYGEQVAVDSAGNALIAGRTWSNDFVGKTNALWGLTDAYAAKVLSTTGALAWATYVGGGADDYGYGIDVDAAGNAFLTGQTASSNFPGRTNSYQGGTYDAFAAKVLSTNGALSWATYLGGSDYDIGYGISLDASGKAFVAGITSSSNFVGKTNTYQGGSHDAFAAQVSPEGAVQWATYLGGSDKDQGLDISAAPSGGAFVAGDTSSTNFTGKTNTYRGGYNDAFAAKVSAAGAVQWATYLGGSGYDQGQGIAAGASDAFLAGLTSSTDLYGKKNTYQGGGYDAFEARISAAGAVQWATYLGGSGNDFAYGIALDAPEKACVTGATNSTNFIGKTNALYGGYDAFVAKVSPTGDPQWATYLGGSGADYGNGIALDAADHAFVTGYTYSSNFAEANNGYHGSRDAFAAKLAVAADCTWDGGGADGFWTTEENWADDAAPLPGDNLLFPADAARLECVNDYPAGTVFGKIAVEGVAYQFQNFTLISGSVVVQDDAQLTVPSIVAHTLTIGGDAKAAAPTAAADNGETPAASRAPEAEGNSSGLIVGRKPNVESQVQPGIPDQKPTTVADLPAPVASAADAVYAQYIDEPDRKKENLVLCQLKFDGLCATGSASADLIATLAKPVAHINPIRQLSCDKTRVIFFPFNNRSLSQGHSSWDWLSDLSEDRLKKRGTFQDLLAGEFRLDGQNSPRNLSPQNHSSREDRPLGNVLANW